MFVKNAEKGDTLKFDNQRVLAEEYLTALAVAHEVVS
jgi:hypothetical protein